MMTLPDVVVMIPRDEEGRVESRGMCCMRLFLESVICFGLCLAELEEERLRRRRKICFVIKDKVKRKEKKRKKREKNTTSNF